MNKIPRYVFVSPVLFLLIFFSWGLGNLVEFIILFLIITIHELAHILAAKMYKLKIMKVNLTPIGINAKIDFSRNTKYNEYVISFAGPFSNLLMAGGGYIVNSYFWDKSNYMSFFIISNIAIFLLNIMPVLPLDGGRIFKKILLSNFGYRYSIKILGIISGFFSCVFIVLGIYQLINFGYNLSLLFIGIFIYINMYKEKDEMQFAAITEVLFKRKRMMDQYIFSVETLMCCKDAKVIEVVKKFRSNKYHVIKVMNENMNQLGELTEEELLDGVINYNVNVTLGELMK